jgi:hypothetical protein
MKEIYIDVYDLKNKTYSVKGLTMKEAAVKLNVTHDEVKNCIYDCRSHMCRKRYLMGKTGTELDISIKYDEEKENALNKSDVPHAKWEEWDKIHELARMIKSGKAVIKSRYKKGKKIRYMEVC